MNVKHVIYYLIIVYYVTHLNVSNANHHIFLIAHTNVSLPYLISTSPMQTVFPHYAYNVIYTTHQYVSNVYRFPT